MLNEIHVRLKVLRETLTGSSPISLLTLTNPVYELGDSSSVALSLPCWLASRGGTVKVALHCPGHSQLRGILLLRRAHLDSFTTYMQ